MAIRRVARTISGSGGLEAMRETIGEASQLARSAVGSATQFIKAVQEDLKEAAGPLVTAHVSLYSNDDDDDAFTVEAWDGHRIRCVSGVGGDDPRSFSYKAALEVPGHLRLRIAKRLPELVGEIRNAASESAATLGRLADEARGTKASNNEVTR